MSKVEELIARVRELAPTYYPDVPPDEEDWKDYLAYFAPKLAEMLDMAVRELEYIATRYGYGHLALAKIKAMAEGGES